MREAGVDLIYRSALYFSALSAIHKKNRSLPIGKLRKVIG